MLTSANPEHVQQRWFGSGEINKEGIVDIRGDNRGQLVDGSLERRRRLTGTRQRHARGEQRQGLGSVEFQWA